MLRRTRLWALAVVLPTGCFFKIVDVEPAPSGASAGDAGFGANATSGAAGGAAVGGAGAADAQPIELASGQDSPGALAEDADDLYWTAADGVHRCAKSGEPAWLKKVTDGADLHQLVVDDKWVYFADSANQRIAKVEKQGGLAQTVTAVDGPFALATDGTLLFYGSATGSVFSVHKDNSEVRQLYQGAASQRLDDVYAIAVAGADLVFGDAQGRGVYAVAKDGSSPARELAKVSGLPYGVAVLDARVFFRQSVAKTGTLASVSIVGSEAQDLLTAEPGPGALVALAAHVLFSRFSSEGASIRDFDVPSAQVHTIVSGRAAIQGLQADATSVYWTEPSAGVVMKLDR